MSSFTIDGRLPSLNDHIADNKKTRFRANKLKSENTNWCGFCAIQGLGKHKFSGLITLEFHWIEPNKKRDKDNIAFAKKYILDGMVKFGIIPNDGWANVDGFTDKFSVDKDNPRIEVTIKEVIGQ